MVLGRCVARTVTEKKLHRMLLNRYISAHATGDARPLSIAIVGAGATGVELCAELHDAVRLIEGYGVRPASAKTLKVYIFKAGQRILPAFLERISKALHRALVKLGIASR